MRVRRGESCSRPGRESGFDSAASDRAIFERARARLRWRHRAPRRAVARCPWRDPRAWESEIPTAEWQVRLLPRSLARSAPLGCSAAGRQAGRPRANARVQLRAASGSFGRGGARGAGPLPVRALPASMSQLDDILDPSDPSAALAALGRAVKRAWLNEKFCPRLLPYDEELVESVRATVRDQEEAERKAKGSTGVAANFFHAELHADVERNKFALNSYMRCRLRKIERYTAHFIMQDLGRQKSGEAPLLCDPERAFAMGLLESHSKLVGANVLDALPRDFGHMLYETVGEDGRGEGQWNLVPSPKDDVHVWCHVRRDLGMVELEEGVDPVEMGQGMRRITQHDKIGHLVEAGDIELI